MATAETWKTLELELILLAYKGLEWASGNLCKGGVHHYLQQPEGKLEFCPALKRWPWKHSYILIHKIGPFCSKGDGVHVSSPSVDCSRTLQPYLPSFASSVFPKHLQNHKGGYNISYCNGRTKILTSRLPFSSVSVLNMTYTSQRGRQSGAILRCTVCQSHKRGKQLTENKSNKPKGRVHSGTVVVVSPISQCTASHHDSTHCSRKDSEWMLALQQVFLESNGASCSQPQLCLARSTECQTGQRQEILV